MAHGNRPMFKPQATSTDDRGDQETTPIAADLSSFQVNCLTIIGRYRPDDTAWTDRDDTQTGQPHGLAIKAGLEAFYGKEINHGRLYPNLDKLEEKGLIEKWALDKRTNQYVLTDSGRRALRERVQFLEPAAQEVV